MREGNKSESTTPSGSDADGIVAAERLLRSLGRNGVQYVFANLGTDHTPLLEAAARLREQGDDGDVPAFVVCPHEFVAMSAAHGFAAVSGDPQAVLVHVDVGTQNLGAAMHNAHRAEVPVFVIAGLAPVTDAGYLGSRDHTVHHAQDVFDQPGIVREYCRWVREYRLPADPAVSVSRGLERASSARRGPVYLSVTREALELPVRPSTTQTSDPRRVEPAGADADTVTELASVLADADRPLVVTSDFGRSPADERVNALVDFAETVGAGVVEQSPVSLSFPRSHPLHAGFDPVEAFDCADLVLITATDVPWVASHGTPPPEVPVVQIDPDPTKSTYPHWNFDVGLTVQADPVATLQSVTEALDGSAAGAEWRRFHERLVAERETALEADRATASRTAAELAAAVDGIVDDSTVVVEGAVTSRSAVLDHVELSEPGSFVARGGAGLGWAGGAAVGIKLAKPDHRVVSLFGDGSYLFSNPIAHAWMAAEYGAPTLSIVFNNGGWNAVRTSTLAQHPSGAAAAQDVPESKFGTGLDLSAPARAVDAHAKRVGTEDSLTDALAAAVEAVDSGTPAVLDVVID